MPPTSAHVGHDVICVAGLDKGFGSYSSTEFFIPFHNNSSMFKSMFAAPDGDADSDTEDEKKRFSISRKTNSNNSNNSNNKALPLVIVRCNGVICDSIKAFAVNDTVSFLDPRSGLYTTSPSSDILEQFGFHWGCNVVSFEYLEYNCEVSCNVWYVAPLTLRRVAV